MYSTGLWDADITTPQSASYFLVKYATPGVHICNLGTGKGYSVLEIVQAFEKVNGVKVPYEIKPRRAGDIATCYADPTRAKEQLGWVAEKTLDDMCKDTWNFAKKHM